ncbi:MAG: hypothetical protein ABI178_01075 [Rhodanobacter sp.]
MRITRKQPVQRGVVQLDAASSGPRPEHVPTFPAIERLQHKLGARAKTRAQVVQLGEEMGCRRVGSEQQRRTIRPHSVARVEQGVFGFVVASA